ncbi:MAG: tetratricopeptide repeat protein [Deltaproteobacteria bacterium]|nr:tetratricopeptide repeat protein [Deltaproteobacteria bacterium]
MDPVNTYYRAGVEALRAGNAEEAVRLLGLALTVDPEHVPSLSNRAVALRSLGELDEAVADLRHAAHLDGGIPDVWRALAQTLLELGQADEAAEAARRAADLSPEEPKALGLLARVLLTAGRPEEALAPARKAARLAPADPAHVLTLGEVSLQAGKLEAAERAFQKLLALDPRDATAHLYAGMIALELGRPRAAEPHLQAAVGGMPEVLPAWLALSRVQRDQGRLDEAADTLELAAEHHPESAILEDELGHLWLRAGDLERAEDSLREAVDLDPTLSHAAHALGTLLRGKGQLDEALELHRLAVRGEDVEGWAWIGLADAIAFAPTLPDDLEPEVLGCLAAEGVDHQALDRAVRSLLARAEGVAEVLAGAPLHGGVARNLADHPLFSPWLERVLCTDPSWERLLVALRDQLLAELPVATELPKALIALATQSWHNEYAWPLPTLPEGLTGARRALAQALAGPLPAPGDGALAALSRLTRDEPAEELRLAAAVPTLAMTDDPVSAAVQAQYEEHPYPRLVSFHHKPPEPLHQLVRGLFPHLDHVPAPAGALEILVAGCGTGQQALSAATRYAGARVLAVDLSRRSLGATARRAAAWGLDNLEVMQADILALGALERRFHLVESGGVLHHMADPLAGWRVLTDLTVPGGLMKIGLYSESGREGVMAARALAAAADLSADADGLRAARALFHGLPADHPAREVLRSPDFYSLTGLRDLVMHVHEHRFTIPLLIESLEALELRFVGFQHARPEPDAWYDALWPDDPRRDDLRRWQAVEEAHPRVFAGMYQFWCAKHR